VTSPDQTPRPPKGGRVGVATAVAAAVDSVAGVRRSGGSGVEVATYYPGGRLVGIRLGDDHVLVQVAAARFPLDTVAEEVQAAVHVVLEALGDPRSVVVSVCDIDISVLPPRTFR
jgi:hypothetical protein